MPLKIFKKSSANIKVLCKLLKEGEVIAAPTETAFGLLADATNKQAINRVYGLKGRGKAKPLPLIVANMPQARSYVKFSPIALKLAKKFWPGPLTLILPACCKLPVGVMSKNNEVGVRITGSLWLRKLIVAYGRPLVATSANRAGAPTLYSATAVKRVLANRGLRYLVEGRSLLPRPTSTVLLVRGAKVLVLRTGAVSLKILKKFLPTYSIINN